MKRLGATAEFVVKFESIEQGNDSIVYFKDGHLVLAGGRDEDEEMLSSVEILNMEGGQWQSAEDMPAATVFHCQVICHFVLWILKFNFRSRKVYLVA